MENWIAYWQVEEMPTSSFTSEKDRINQKMFSKNKIILTWIYILNIFLLYLNYVNIVSVVNMEITHTHIIKWRSTVRDDGWWGKIPRVQVSHGPGHHPTICLFRTIINRNFKNAKKIWISERKYCIQWKSIFKSQDQNL